MKGGSVYILASRMRGTLYIGVTSDLVSRIAEHKAKSLPGFTACHDVLRLVWFEHYVRIGDAIQREKSLKRWYRAWKVRLVEERNPGWRDLYDDLVAEWYPSHEAAAGT